MSEQEVIERTVTPLTASSLAGKLRACGLAEGQTVLVHMAMTDETWHLVKGVPRIAGFIGGTENRPMPISDREANEIIQQVTDSADTPKMKFTFAPGELVRIIDGPFADFNGTVEDANFEKAKLRVSVTIFGRSTPVELDFTQVEKG